MAYKLPENLFKYRKTNGFTQQNIADIFSLDRSSYSYYETGKTSPSIETLVRLSRLFDISIEDLLGLTKSNAEMGLNEDSDFSFRKKKLSIAPLCYMKVISKVLDVYKDDLIFVEQLIASHYDSLMLNEESSFSLRKKDASNTAIGYKQIISMLLDLSNDSLRAVEQEIDRLLKSYE